MVSPGVKILWKEPSNYPVETIALFVTTRRRFPRILTGFCISLMGSLNRELLTVKEFCAEWKIARSTFYQWLATGTAPQVIKLPNGALRIDRRAVEAWESVHLLTRTGAA
jgi:predicted DNA-binding transcriptional regulator AlpA